MRASLLAAMLIFASPASFAQENDWVYGAIVEWGIGNDPCSEFVAAMESQPHNIYATFEGHKYPTMSHTYMQWLAGYLTAYSHAKSVTINLPGNSLDSAMSWLRQTCKAKPGIPFSIAVNQYAATFSEPSFTK